MAAVVSSAQWQTYGFEVVVVDLKVYLNLERDLIGVGCVVGGELHAERQLLS